MAKDPYDVLATRNAELEEEKYQRLQQIEALERKVNHLTTRLSDATEMIQGCPSMAAARRRDAGIIADAMDWVLAQATNEDHLGSMWRTRLVAPRIAELRIEAEN